MLWRPAPRSGLATHGKLRRQARLLWAHVIYLAAQSTRTVVLQTPPTRLSTASWVFDSRRPQVFATGGLKPRFALRHRRRALAESSSFARPMRTSEVRSTRVKSRSQARSACSRWAQWAFSDGGARRKLVDVSRSFGVQSNA